MTEDEISAVRGSHQLADEHNPKELFQAQKAVSGCPWSAVFQGTAIAKTTGCHLLVRCGRNCLAKWISSQQAVKKSDIYQWPRKYICVIYKLPPILALRGKQQENLQRATRAPNKKTRDFAVFAGVYRG